MEKYLDLADDFVTGDVTPEIVSNDGTAVALLMALALFATVPLVLLAGWICCYPHAAPWKPEPVTAYRIGARVAAVFLAFSLWRASRGSALKPAAVDETHTP